MKRIHVITLAAFALCAAVAVSALAVSALAQDDEQDSAPPGSAPTAQKPDPRVKAVIGALRTDRSMNDALPPDIAAFFLEARPQGANPRFSRRALTKGGRSLFLLPAQEGVCAVLPDQNGGAGMACDPLSRLEAGDTAPSTLRVQDSVTFYGTVRDGVDEVFLELASGKRVASPVEGNVYLVEVDAAVDPVALSYEAPSGRQTFPVNAPEVPPQP